MKLQGNWNLDRSRPPSRPVSPMKAILLIVAGAAIAGMILLFGGGTFLASIGH